MLFLMNDQVLDIGDPLTTVRENLSQLTEIPFQRIDAKATITLAQALFFHCPADKKPMPGALRALAGLITDHTEANAALFVCPPNASGPQQVQIRLAEVQLPVMANLFQLQKRQPLSPTLVNNSVWASAA